MSSPVQPDGAIQVFAFEEHEHPVRSLNDFKWARGKENTGNSGGVAFQNRVIQIGDRSGSVSDLAARYFSCAHGVSGGGVLLGVA